MLLFNKKAIFINSGFVKVLECLTNIAYVILVQLLIQCINREKCI